MAAITAVVGLSLAAPAPARADTFTDCINEAITRISATAATLPADQRSAYLATEIKAAQTRCGAALVGTTTTTPPPGSTYDVNDSEPVVSGQQRTLEANCRPGDRLVRYTYDVPSTTGSNTSRSVTASSSGTGARVTFRVVGTVTSPTATLTVTCRAAA